MTLILELHVTSLIFGSVTLILGSLTLILGEVLTKNFRFWITIKLKSSKILKVNYEWYYLGDEGFHEGW